MELKKEKNEIGTFKLSSKTKRMRVTSMSYSHRIGGVHRTPNIEYVEMTSAELIELRKINLKLDEILAIIKG